MEEVLINLRAVLANLENELDDGLIVLDSQQDELADLCRQLQAHVYAIQLFEAGVS